MCRDNPPHGHESHYVLQNNKETKGITLIITVCHFISDVTYGPCVVDQEESDHETTGFTDDNQSWLKPVAKKKRKQVLGSDGEEQQSDVDGSIAGEEEQSDVDGSITGEEQQSDVDGSTAGEEEQSGSEGSAEGEEVQLDLSGSSDSEDRQSEQEEMSFVEDKDYRVSKLPTFIVSLEFLPQNYYCRWLIHLLQGGSNMTGTDFFYKH
jgi:hypothetical protein